MILRNKSDSSDDRGSGNGNNSRRKMFAANQAKNVNIHNNDDDYDRSDIENLFRKSNLSGHKDG